MLNKLGLFITLLFFALIFTLSVNSSLDFDIWFHLKSGEIISQMGIIWHDVFSFTAQNRQWSPYEWLFQISIFQFRELFGFEAIKYLMAAVSTAIIFFLYLILNKIFNLNFYLSLFLSFVFFASAYEFISPRPHLLAYLFLNVNLYLLLNYFFKGKNFLFLTFPLTLAWANLHGSIFLNVFFFISFSLISLANHYFLKDDWFKKFKTLSLFSVVTVVLTILPPLNFLQYQLLWRFFQQRDLITKFISEWTPLAVSPISFILYTLTTLAVLIFSASVIFKQKGVKKLLWVLPLLPLILSPYLASRNSFLGFLALILIFGAFLAKIDFFKIKKTVKLGLLGLLALAFTFHLWMLFDKKREQMGPTYYPVQATKFIKDYNPKGNMFNEYGFGGYLLYHLYPAQKVYIDGRTDLYLCCEMPDTLELSYQKNLSNAEYQKLLQGLFNKNNISFVVLRTEKHSVIRKIATILQSHPDWALVFWDDASMIFVKKDGKNNDLIKLFAAISATPYDRNPYRENQEEKAFEEYRRMVKVADSAKSRNAIGFLLLRQAKFDGAKREFEKAIELNPFNESPYMNLAELAAKDRDDKGAIELYEKARKLAPDRGLIYIRLGRLILSTYGDRERARNIWQEGLEKTVDEDAKETLNQLLKENPASF